MDPKHIQRTLDLILGQLGTVTQQIRETQGDLADFRRQAGERLDNIERLGNPAIYTPSRPHSPYGEDTRTEYGPPRDHYRPNHRPIELIGAYDITMISSLYALHFHLTLAEQYACRVNGINFAMILTS
ncbi:hypothetical protein M5K25_024124 [Dendrobium thyrsiflorum]|uniref:Uncharacterized protein n=1 Tax=Dendrobium thyrsiflorum TaxID=117978 RepID=A0ABD0U165_DENTH